MKATVEILRVANLAAVFLMALLALRHWRRRGSEAAGWAAAAFVGLASVFAFRHLLPHEPTGNLLAWVDKVSLIPAVGFPYFLFRFATSFRAASPALSRSVMGAALAVTAWTLVLPAGAISREPRPLWVEVYLLSAVGYWSVVSAFVAARLWLDGRDQPAVPRRRMRTLSLASLTLSAAVLLGTRGQPTSVIELAFRSTFALGVLLFLLGFWPPRLLRAVWRRSAEQDLWKGLTKVVAAARQEEAAAEVLSHAVEVVGARGAALVDAEGEVVAASGETPTLAPPGPLPLEFALTSGSLLVWASPYTPFFGQDELDLLASLGVLADLAMNRLRAGEKAAQLAAIVESSNDAIVGTSPDGTILSWNGGAQRLFGYPAEEACGAHISILAPDGTNDRTSLLLAAAGGGQPVANHETRRRGKDGTEVDISLAISPITDSTGEVVGVSGIARDITERKQLEAELARTRDQAIEASRLKSEFLATMSHEIRTPMNGVLGMTGLLLGTELSEEQRDLAETARRSAEALLSVLNDILDFSKIEAGKLDLEVVDFDLRRILEEVDDLLAGQARAKGLDLATAVDADLAPALRGDPGRIRQILLNLVGNAVKFTEQGQVVVTAAVLDRGPGGDLVSISVSDTGIGIDPEAQQRLFQSFSQADASTTRRYGGSGLGLAISQQLAHLMGGTLEVQSEPGVGSTFSLRVRLERSARAPAPAERSHPAVPRVGWAGDGSGAGAHLLVVEDNLVNQKVAARLIERLGYRVDVVANGVEAMKALSTMNYDAILMDCQMPEMDGYQAAAQIRSDEGAGRHTPIIAMTAGAMKGDEDKARAAGMDDYVTKPIKPEVLAEVLRRWLGERGAARPAER